MPTQTIDTPSNEILAEARNGSQPIITTDHEQALRAELERLRRRLEDEFTERLRDAREFGSVDANDDYLQIKEEEAVLAAGIARISTLLDTALIVDPARAERGMATLGSVVEVRDRDSGRRMRLRLIGGHEPLSGAVASAGSPVGQALMGRRQGEMVEVVLPGGRLRRLEILAVEASRR
jgi:transcription elongation factor GreA